jgi:hypothetical protein
MTLTAVPPSLRIRSAVWRTVNDSTPVDGESVTAMVTPAIGALMLALPLSLPPPLHAARTPKLAATPQPAGTNARCRKMSMVPFQEGLEARRVLLIPLSKPRTKLMLALGTAVCAERPFAQPLVSYAAGVM